MSVAYLFPGQGAQFVGMGHDLFTQIPQSKAVFEAADEILGFSLSELCFSGPEDELTDTVNQQPALFVTSIAMLKAMKNANWDFPDFVAGHSLGELTALAAAESITFEDGLKLVRRRGELMKAAGERDPGGMAATLGADQAQVTAACAQAQNELGKPVQIANDNCPGQIVISGDQAAVARASEILAEAGIRKIVQLPITIAAHSSLMGSAASEFAAAVDALNVHAPKVPIVGNTTATMLVTPDEIRAELKAQLTGSVRWTESLELLIANGVDTMVEVGAGDTLQKLMRRIDRKVKRTQFTL